MGQYTGLLGVLVLLGIAYVLSSARRAINWRIVAVGVVLQFVIAYLCLRSAPVVRAFEWFAGGVTRVISFADEGIRFLFGNLADGSPTYPWGVVFAVQVLPIILFFASLMAVLYHLGIMQRVVAGVAWVLRRTMGITGVEALSAAANIFMGQTEAPLTVKPYIAGMTRSQLMAVMTGGFATIAGSVLAAYVGILGDAYGGIRVAADGLAGEEAKAAMEAGRTLFAKHLLTASVMSAPAGLVMAKMMLPETETQPAEELRTLLSERGEAVNVVDAAAMGATDGLKLALNVAAMLVAFVALLAMLNYPLAALSECGPIAEWRGRNGVPVLTFQNILGYVLMPLAWVMGVEWKDCRGFGGLLGTQVIATEFIAYLDLSKHLKAGTLSPRTCEMATYALCGFANLPSIAIQIGGLSAMAPSRRADLARIAPRAMVAGALACWMTCAVAGVMMG